MTCDLYPRGSCDFPAPKECNTTEPPSLYWARFVVANYFQHVVEAGTLFDTSVTNTTFNVERITDDFPVQTPDTFDLGSLFGSLAAALTMGAGAIGVHPGGAGLAGFTTVVSGAFSLIAGEIGDETGVTDPTDVLRAQMGVIFDAVYNAMAKSLIDMFEKGDLSSWSTSLTEGEYKTEIANFFDGQFMFKMKGSEAMDLQKEINRYLSKTLASTALRAANYYILQDSHPVDTCKDFRSGRVIDGKCYTIEGPGNRYMEKEFSVPISKKALEKVTDKYEIDLDDLYRLSLTCQKDTGVYAGNIKIPEFSLMKELPDCFYNMPVFYVEPSKSSAPSNSPCAIWAVNATSQDGDKPEVGISYMPDNLAGVFKIQYCTCYPPTAPFCNLGRANGTDLTLSDLGNLTNETRPFIG